MTGGSGYRARRDADGAGQMIAVLAGGVGAARMLDALSGVTDPARLTAVVNTADDSVLNGLHISPDIDTVVYTLGGAIDPERGWGLAGETWRAMESLGRYAWVRPSGSAAAPTWFNLGDQDLATHMYRTARLAEGATLTEVTTEIATAWDLAQRVMPMTDDRVRTRLTLTDGTEIDFQEYFVHRRHEVAVKSVRFDGAPAASLTSAARSALTDAELVVIAPSNPIVSIGPIRAIAGVDGILAARRETVVAVSPIVGGAALKGPADRLMTELGVPATVAGVASLYAEVASVLVIDPLDAHLAAEVEAAGMRAVVTPSVMSVPGVAAELARRVLAAGSAAAG